MAATKEELEAVCKFKINRMLKQLATMHLALAKHHNIDVKPGDELKLIEEVIAVRKSIVTFWNEVCNDLSFKPPYDIANLPQDIN